MNAAVGADERLVVMLEARVTEFERRMQQAERRGTQTYQGLRRNSRSATRQMEQDMIRSTGSINRAIASTTGRIGSLAASFAGGAVAGAAVGLFAGVSGSIATTIRSMAELGDEAKRAGLSAQAFQEWKYVADQNRVGVDALVDGFKELSLRADEFITTGKGSSAEAFTRLGFSAETLAKKLKDPSALMLEIMGRLEGLDKAAQIRIADEVFGGTGGEQFVQLLGQGEGALQDTINRAHETGAVLDDELIQKAEEIDRKFAQLTGTVGNFAKRVVVEVVAAGLELSDLRDRLDGLFASEDQGRAILGNELYDSLAQNRDMVDENAEALGVLNQQYMALAEEADRSGIALIDAISKLDSMGYEDAADGLRAAYSEMQALVEAFRQGEVSGEDFTAKLGDIEDAAGAAFDQLDASDRVQFTGVISQLERLGGVIGGIISLAGSMGAALARAAGVSLDQKAGQALRDRHAAEAASLDSLEAQRAATEGFTQAETARNSASAEQLRLQREIEAVRNRAGESGASLTEQQATAFATASLAAEDARREAGRPGRGGGGAKGGGGKSGGREKLDEYQREAEAIRDRTLALEAEAASLIVVAESGADYGDALEYARTRAELLHAAQEAGKAITLELTAQIDQLAQGYVTAGLEAEAAAKKMEQIQEQSERGKSALEGMFGSIIDGSMSAKDAVLQLLAEIAKTQMIKGLMALPGIGATSGFLGGLLGFADGGFTGMGGKHDPAGIVHRGEYVMSAQAVQRLGVGNLDAMHKSALRGYASGGPVGMSAPSMQRGGTQEVDVHVTVGVDEKSGNLTAFVDKRVSGGVQQSFREYNRDFNQRVVKAQNNCKHAPRAVWRGCHLAGYRMSLWTHTKTPPAFKFCRFRTRAADGGSRMMRSSGSSRRAIATA
jgi:lambda family phage tail tape measure protein